MIADLYQVIQTGQVSHIIELLTTIDLAAR